MLLHEFQPGKLITGLTLSVIGVLYLGDAVGAWTVPWFALIPILFVGLGCAALAAVTAYSLRRRSRRKASIESSGAPASTSETQPTR